MVRGGYSTGYYPFRCSFEVQYYLYMNNHHCLSGSIISSRCRSSTFDTDNEKLWKAEGLSHALMAVSGHFVFNLLCVAGTKLKSQSQRLESWQSA